VGGMAERQADLPVLHELGELVDLVAGGEPLYVRWSRGPGEDLSGPASMDDLTGVPLPGLSASPLAVEPWWGDRSPRLWVARRLYDYVHLRADKGPGVGAWVLTGHEEGRGPDNEPLVGSARPVALLAPELIDEATEEVERASRSWGPLRRGGSTGR